MTQEVSHSARNALADAYNAAGLRNIAGWVKCGAADESTHTPALMALTASHAEAAELRARVEALEEENARLKARLKAAEWFYYGDECSSDQCRDSIDECIDEDFRWDNKPEGDHVLLVSGARPVPDMWVALHYYTEAEKDERGSDDEYAYTVHATEDEARQALGTQP